MHESILVYSGRRYLWVALAVIAVAAAVYGIHDPGEPPNGGTWLGYTLGTLSAMLIVWLMWFGVRKRSYMSTAGTTQGWLSGHVYLGTTLLVLATLHSGMQMGWNVHTLAYVFMWAVILSGFYGVYAYRRYPRWVTENRGEMNREQMLARVSDIDRRCMKVAQELPTDIQELTTSAVNRTTVGGGWRAQLSGKDYSQVVMPASSDSSETGHEIAANPDQQTAIFWLADRLSRSTDAGLSLKLKELESLLAGKAALLRRVRADIRLHGFLQAWLYVHVPLSFGLIAALFVHIITVFLYW